MYLSSFCKGVRMQKKYILSKNAVLLKDKKQKARLVAVPVDSLIPSIIKDSYEKRADLPIQRTTYYNCVVDAFGVNDWSKYDSFYTDLIVPFMEQYGLKFYAPESPIDLLNGLFTYRSVSDRLFFSGRPIPTSIFTGYLCKIDHEHFYNPGVVFGKSIKSYDQIVSEVNVDLLIPYEQKNNYLNYFWNLLGDVFVHNNSDTEDQYIARDVFNGSYETSEKIIQQAKELHKLLLKCTKGWLEIIPFNKNLIFLKAENGVYDFVFRHLRDSDFEDESPFRPYLNHDRIPSAMNEKYDFARWLYFGRKEDTSTKKLPDTRRSFWLEKDKHLANIAFYESGGREYPGYNNLLKIYYENEGKYSYERKISTKLLDSFHEIKLSDGKVLCVSDLITIDEFSKFYIDESPIEIDDKRHQPSQSYLKERHKENDIWEAVNLDPGTYPTIVTWYDAVAYCRWFELKHNVSVRLLSAPEWFEIFDNPQKVANLNHLNPWSDELVCFTPECDVIEDITERRNDFNEIFVRFKEAPKMIPQINGLQLCINHHFSEWLLEFDGHAAAMVTPALMKPLTLSFLSDDELSKPSFPATSTGKYKYQKIGFRICYEK